MDKDLIRMIAQLIGEMEFIKEDLAEIRESLSYMEHDTQRIEKRIIHNRPVIK